jgi:hypothetical protein
MAVLSLLRSEPKREEAEEYERLRPEREAQQARRKQEVEDVCDAFRRASGLDTTD